MARKISQVKPCAPLDATAPSVSSPTSVQIRKNSMSKRPKCFWSFAFSSTAAAVVKSTNSESEIAVIAASYGPAYGVSRQRPDEYAILRFGAAGARRQPARAAELEPRGRVDGGGDPARSVVGRRQIDLRARGAGGGGVAQHAGDPAAGDLQAHEVRRARAGRVRLVH